jgi:ABC-type uncharacterized transport system YnjBCD ATPase subunit
MALQTNPLIYGMDINTARRYLAVMDKINGIADRIHALADIMSLLLEIPEGEVQIKPQTIGYISKMIATDIMWMVSHLDNDFACSGEIEVSLKQLDQSC